MRLPVLLFVFCTAVAAVLTTIPSLADAALIAGVAACAALVLVFRAGQGRRRKSGGRSPDLPQIVVDGSNVLYWRDNSPDIATLKAVVGHLIALGYHPGVVFDANAGYLVAGAFWNDVAFGQMLGLHRDQILVVPKGTPADVYILAAAQQAAVPILSNDRYRDWEKQYPEIRQPGRLIRGGWRDGRVWVDMDAFARDSKAA